jgi:T4 bacteriophage base plate protein
MALPKIKHPTYSITIPSTGQKVNIRPFTVQEEKLLLMAKSSDNINDTVTTIKQVINNCIMESVDVEKFATFDIEYLFIKLRAKSVGEIVDLEYTVPETNENIKFKINLDDIEVKRNPDHKNKFNLYENIGVVMRYPTLNELKNIESEADENKILEVLFNCIEKIYDDDTVYNDFNEKELQEFIDSLPLDSLNNIKSFFETMPSVEHQVQLKNKDGKVIDVNLKGLNSFFT